MSDNNLQVTDIIEKLVPLDVQVSALNASERIIAILPIHVQAKLIKILLAQNILLLKTLDNK